MMTRSPIRLIASLLIALSLSPALASKATQPSRMELAVNDVLQRWNPGERHLHQVPSLRYLYQHHGAGTLWMAENTWSPAARELLLYIRQIYSHGLAAERYHYSALKKLSQQQGRKAQLLAEILLSDAFLQLLIDLDSREGQAGIIEKGHLAVLLDEARRSQPRRTLNARLPQEPQYWALRDALKEWLSASAPASSAATPLPHSTLLREGDQGPAVQALAERLHMLGDLPGAPGAHFTAELGSALKRFQARHHLDVDGMLGPMTLAELNADHASRTQQIISNLQRWRRMRPSPAASYIRVNIPAQQLRYVHEGEEVLRMKVIVGRPDRPTPQTSGAINELVLNPDWTVPYRIAVKDKLPLIQQDPGYLDRHGFSVSTGWERGAPQVSAEEVDWQSLTASNFPYVLRQQPGPGNALGRVKFLFPNPYSVYLHDTPQDALFQRNQRLFSSGCVRLSEPLELAAWVLRHHGGDNLEVDLSEQTAEPRSIALRSALPVHLQYWSAWVDERKQLQFYPDVYGRDARLLTGRQQSGHYIPAPQLTAHLHHDDSDTLLAQGDEPL